MALEVGLISIRRAGVELTEKTQTSAVSGRVRTRYRLEPELRPLGMRCRDCSPRRQAETSLELAVLGHS